MIRTVVTPVNTDLHIALPSGYVGKELEVLVFTTEEAQDFTGNETTLNLETYNKEIDDAMTRINNGQYTTQEDFEKELDSW